MQRGAHKPRGPSRESGEGLVNYSDSPSFRRNRWRGCARRTERSTVTFAAAGGNSDQPVAFGGHRVWATLTGSGLHSAGAELAAAVAVLGEHQVTTENPAALAEVAVGLTNAGRILLQVAREEDWSKARRMLADAAWNLAVAGAAVGSTLLAGILLGPS